MLGMQSTELVDAIDLLTKDHRSVEELFDQFEDAKESRNDDEMASLVASICSALTVHAQIDLYLYHATCTQAEHLWCILK